MMYILLTILLRKHMHFQNIYCFHSKNAQIIIMHVFLLNQQNASLWILNAIVFVFICNMKGIPSLNTQMFVVFTLRIYMSFGRRSKLFVCVIIYILSVKIL